MAKIICDYCEYGTKSKLCYKGGYEKCRGELFLARQTKQPSVIDSVLNLCDVSNNKVAVKSCNGCDWQNVHDRNELCPICRNYQYNKAFD